MYWFGEIWIVIFVISIIVLFVKVSNLKREVEILRSKISTKNNQQEDYQVGLASQAVENEVPQYFVVGDEARPLVKEKTVEEKVESEFHMGANWMAIIGVISVLFGLGFFLKYAFDENLITETGRVALGFISGIATVSLGFAFRNKLKDWSHYVMGGGLALLILSAYFGLDYQMYPNAIAFVIMIVITFVGGFLAHILNSKILAGITILSGFLAPILASSGQANEIVLFNYILILLGGMFFLVKKHGWNFLIGGSLIGTGILYGGSMAEYYTNSVFWIYWVYLIIFFGIFAVAPLYAYFADREDGFEGSKMSLLTSTLVGGIFMGISYLMFQGVWDEMLSKNVHFKNFYWVIALIPALTYLWLSTRALKFYETKRDSLVLYFMIGMASFSIAMVPALQFTGKWITGAWLVEGIVLAWIFYKTEIKTFLTFGIISLGAGLVRLFSIDSYYRTREYMESAQDYVSTYTPIFNERTLIYGVGVVSLFAVAYFAFYKNEKNIAKWLGIVANGVILYWIGLEIFSWNIADDTASILFSLAYLIYAGILIWIGVVKKYSGFRILGLLLIAFVILKAYTYDIVEMNMFAKFIMFTLLGVAIIGVSFKYHQLKEKIKEFI